MFKTQKLNWLFNLRFIAALYFAVTVTISLLQYYQGNKTFDNRTYTRYNNYVIFTHSYQHLAQYQNPYQQWPDEHWDLYKYSPTFCLLIYPFTLLPNLPGLAIWNLLNAFVLFTAIYFMKGISEKLKATALLFILPELIVSLQNSQSNGLVAGLMVAGFNMLQSRRFVLATLLICISAYIKVFGGLAFILCLLYSERWKATLAATCWMIAFAALPLLVINVDQLIQVYRFWGDMLANDQSMSVGLSVLGWLKTWFNYDAPKNVVTALGLLLLVLPLLRFKLYNDNTFRVFMLSGILIWVVIFNHKAESPTFVIAITGAILWYLFSERSKLNLTLLLLAFVFASLSPTDLFPRYLRVNFVAPYVLKAVPMIVLWLKIQYDLLSMKTVNTFSQKSFN